MWISGRQATARLAATGVTSRQARQVLAAGLAGEPQRTTAALLYDADRVAELVARPGLADGAVDRACPFGVFVARRAHDVHGPYDLSPWASVLIRARVADHGFFLLLRPAGDWFAEFTGRRWSTGPGRPWVLYRGPGLRGLVSVGESGP
jgi:hypothetical protein